MYGKYRVRVFALALIGFFTGFFDALSIGTLIPLFSFVTNHDGLGGDIISQALNKLFLFFHLDLNLVSLLIFISLLFILKGAALAVSGILQTKILSDYEYSVRTEIYEKTFQAKWPFLLKLHYEPGEFQLRPLAENLRHASGFKRFSDLRRDGA